MLITFATALLFSVVALLQPNGDAAVIGDRTDILIGGDFQNPMIDTVILTWDPRGQGMSYFKICSLVDRVVYYLSVNNVIAERRANGLIGENDMILEMFTDVGEFLSVMPAFFLTSDIEQYTILSGECLRVSSPFDLSGSIVTRGDLLKEEPTAAELGNDSELYIEAGNNDTVVAAAGADTSSLIANDFAESMLGHADWYHMGSHTYYVPSFPDANQGYYLKMASDQWNRVVSVEVVTSGARQNVDIARINQPATVYVGTNDPCYIISNDPIQVMVFVASGDANFDQSAPSMALVVVPTYWLGAYAIETTPDFGANHYFVFLCRKSEVDKLYMVPNPIDTVNFDVQDDLSQWTAIADSDFVFYQMAVSPDEWYSIWGISKNALEAYTFSVYYHVTCTGGRFCATTELFNWKPDLTQTGSESTASPEATTTLATASPGAPTTVATASPGAPTTSTTASPEDTTTSTTAATTNTQPTPPSPPTTPFPTPGPTPNPTPSSTLSTTTSSNPVPPPAPPPPEFLGCPCVRFHGFGDEDPRLSAVDGIYVMQHGTVNGWAYYKHEGCEYYLYYWAGETSYWLIGPVAGANRGVLLNPDPSRYAHTVAETWRIYNLQTSSWRDSQRVTTSCSCDGVTSCPILVVEDEENSYPGRFHFVDVYNGRPLYKNDITGLYLYYNIEHSSCQRWVIAAERGLVSTRAYVYDASSEPVDIISNWKKRSFVSGWHISSSTHVRCAV